MPQEQTRPKVQYGVSHCTEYSPQATPKKAADADDKGGLSTVGGSIIRSLLSLLLLLFKVPSASMHVIVLRMVTEYVPH